MSNGHTTLFDRLADPTGPLAQRERMMADQRRREVFEEMQNYLRFKGHLGAMFDAFDQQAPADPSLSALPPVDEGVREGMISQLADMLYEPTTEMFQKLRGTPIGQGLGQMLPGGSLLFGPGGDPLPQGVSRSEYNKLLGLAQFYEIPDATEMSPRQLENVINLRRAGLRAEGTEDLSDIPAAQRHLLAGTSAALGGMEGALRQVQKLPVLGNILAERRTIQESEQWLAMVREGLTADLDPVQQVVMEQSAELGDLATYLYAGAAIWRAFGAAVAPSLALTRSGHLLSSSKMAAGSRLERLRAGSKRLLWPRSNFFRQGVIPGAGTGFVLEGGGDAPLVARGLSIAAFGAFGGLIGAGGRIAGGTAGSAITGITASIFTDDSKKVGAWMLAGGFLGAGGIGVLGRAIARSYPRPSQTVPEWARPGTIRPPGVYQGEPVPGTTPPRTTNPAGFAGEAVVTPPPPAPGQGLLPAVRGRLPAPRAEGPATHLPPVPGATGPAIPMPPIGRPITPGGPRVRAAGQGSGSVGMFEPIREATRADLVRFSNELGQAQRGAPERAMVDLQHTMGGGVLNPVIEHVGDLTHRMTHMLDPDKYGSPSALRRNVADKVQKALNRLNDPYGFERELSENLVANAGVRGIPVEELQHQVDAGLQAYADAHRALPVFNRLQLMARDAAVAIGEKDFDGARRILQDLQEIVEDPSRYEQLSREFGFGGEEGISELTSLSRPGTGLRPRDIMPLGEHGTGDMLVRGLNTQEAAAEADALTRQRVVLESSDLDQAVARPYLDDYDAARAAANSRPAHIAVLRGVGDMERVMWRASQDASDEALMPHNFRFVEHKSGRTDVLISRGENISVRHRDQYKSHGVFEGQLVEHNGNQLRVSDFHEDGFVTVEEPGGNWEMTVHVDDLIPSMWGEEPSMLDMPFMYAEIVARAQQLTANDPLPVRWTDEAMNERVPQVVQDYFEAEGITSPVEQAAIEAYVSQRRLDDLRFEHAPEEAVELLRQNARAAESFQRARDVGDYQPKRSLEEIAVDHGYEWHPNSPALPPGHTGRLVLDEGDPFNEAIVERGQAGVTEAFFYEFDGPTPSETGQLGGRINRNTGEITVAWVETGGGENALGYKLVRDHGTELDRQLRAKGFEPTTIEGLRAGGARKAVAMRRGAGGLRRGTTADPSMRVPLADLIRSKGKGGKLVQAEKVWISPDKVIYARRYDETPEIRSRSFQIKAPEPSEAHQVAAREMVEVLKNVVPEGGTPILIPLPGRSGDIGGNGPLALEIQRLFKEQGGNAGVVPILAKHPGESQLARRMGGKPGQGPDDIQLFVTDAVNDVGALLEQPNLFLLDNAVVTGASARAAQIALGQDIPVLAYVRAEPPVVEELPFESEGAALEFLRSQERTPPDLDPMGSVSADIVGAVPGGHPESLGPEPAPTLKALTKNLDRSAKLIALEAQADEVLWTGGFAGMGPQAPPPAPPGGGGTGGPPPQPPQLPPGGGEPPADLGFGDLLTELRNASPRDYALRARAIDNFFARWGLARQPWYSRMDRILAEFAQEQGLPRPPSLEKATSDVMNGQSVAHSKMRPWSGEAAGIIANFKPKHMAEGTVARAMVRPEVAVEAGFTPREIASLDMLRDWERRMQTSVFGRPVGSIFEEIVALRVHQARMSSDDAYKSWADQLPDEMKWVADHFKRTRLQGKNVDIGHLVEAYVRGMFFEKHVGKPWARARRLVDNAYQGARGTEMEDAFIMTLGWLDHVRHGIDPGTDAAVSATANLFRDFLGVPVTNSQIYRAFGGALGLMYRGLIGLKPDLILRDGMQFTFNGAELGFKWTGLALKRYLDPKTHGEVMRYAIDNGIVELGRVQIPVAEIFGSEPMIGEEPAFQGMQKAVRDLANKGGQAVKSIMPKFLRKGITDTWMDPLWAYSRTGQQWNRALAGETGRLKAEDALSRLDSFTSTEALLEAAGMSHYDEPIRHNFLQLVQAGDIAGAIREAALNAANSQHRYGTLETSHGIREHGMFGKMGSVFATFTMQYAHRMWWNLAPERFGGGGRSFASKIKFMLRYYAVYAGINYAIDQSGWEGLKKWHWHRSLMYPIAWPIQTLINVIHAAGAYMAEEVFDENPTPEQRSGRAMLEMRPVHEYFNPIQGGINTFQGVNAARSPRELARFLFTGEEGPSDLFNLHFQQGGPGTDLQYAPQHQPQAVPGMPWQSRDEVLTPYFDAIFGPKGGQ